MVEHKGTSVYPAFFCAIFQPSPILLILPSLLSRAICVCRPDVMSLP